MMTTASEIEAFLDRERIRDCIARLARGEDRRDARLIEACYWPDSSFDYGMYAGSFAAYLAWVVPGAEAITNTQHVIAQSVIELSGETAKVETHVLAFHRVATGGEDGSERDTVIGGRYLDVLAKRAGEWRIAHRTMLYDWLQDLGTAADWSQGVMGYPFSAPHYAGRANADWSETFFGPGGG